MRHSSSLIWQRRRRGGEAFAQQTAWTAPNWRNIRRGNAYKQINHADGTTVPEVAERKPRRHCRMSLLGYMAAKYAEMIKNKTPLPWPVILPMVVHHSRTGWTASTSYHDLFDQDVLNIPGVRAAVPSFSFFLSHLAVK